MQLFCAIFPDTNVYTGEVVDVSPDSTDAQSAPCGVKYFYLSNSPREHSITFASWMSASDLVASSSQWATIAVYARITPTRDSIEETFLRDQTPLQEILSGIMGSKERPNVVGVGGIYVYRELSS